MRDRRLTRLFARFQRQGDVAALTTIFKDMAPVLLSLARHLLRRPEDAEGGRVAFHVSSSTAAEPGRWSLRGETSPDRFWLMSWDPARHETRVLYTSFDIDGDGEYWLHHALLPGEYRLVVTRGEVEEESHSFLVSPGGVADVFLEN